MRNLFKSIGRLIGDNGLVLIAIVGFLAFFIVASVTRCTDIHQGPTAQVQNDPEVQLESQLSNSAKAERNNYGESTTALINLMRANLWVADKSDGITLKFTSKTMTERNSKGDEWATSYVVVSTRETTDGAGRPVTIACVRTTEWTDIMTVTTEKNSSGNITSVTLECPSLPNKSYHIATAAKKVEVDGPSDAWLRAHGSSEEALNDRLSQWCGLNWPTVSQLTWDKKSSEDQAAGTVTFSLSMNSKQARKVTVTIDTTTGDIKLK